MQIQVGELQVNIDIVGYQFPEATEVWDANWLNIRVQLRLADGRVWERTDPCMEVQEAQRLASWLDEVGRHAALFVGWQHETLHSDVMFTEPCLSFSARSPWFHGSERRDFLFFRVIMSNELVPPFADELAHLAEEDGQISEAWLDCPLDQEALAVCAAEWRTQLTQFPPRGTP